jgi:hypothetical protein
LLRCPVRSNLEAGRGGGARAQGPGLRCSSWGVRAWLRPDKSRARERQPPCATSATALLAASDSVRPLPEHFRLSLLRGIMLHPLLAQHLTCDDDADLWETATATLLAEAGASAFATQQDIYAQLGCCHHWISPHHPIRWAADGGFAWPFGYDKTTTGWSYRALPELSWSEFLKWAGKAWESGRTGKQCLVFRIAIPARTARHLQAAIHTIWTPHSPTTREKIVRLYGFRKQERKWSLTASDEIQPMTRRGRTRRCT